MKVSIIVAHSENLAIGLDNKMLWRLSDDFKNYKKITMGHCLVMGRKTFESIGKPLPGRTSIVISRNKSYSVPDEVVLVHSLEDALKHAESIGETNCFINGGGEIYKQSIPHLTDAHITFVHTEISKADAFLPQIDLSLWNKKETFDFNKDEKNQYNWTYTHFEK